MSALQRNWLMTSAGKGAVLREKPRFWWARVGGALGFARMAGS